MSGLNEYYKSVDEFRKKINSVPVVIEKLNNKVDFSSGRYQEIMIDVEGSITTLADDFYLFAEFAEEQIKNTHNLTIDKCIEYLTKNRDEITVGQHDELMKTFIDPMFEK